MGGERRAVSSATEPEPDAARDPAEQIWRGAVGDSVPGAEVAGLADHFWVDLRIGMVRWIGGEAYRTLLARTLGETRPGHPALAGLTGFGEDEPAIRAVVRKHGADAAIAGMVAVLRAMISLLGRIMGNDMAVHLVQQICLPSLPGGARRERAEADDG